MFIFGPLMMILTIAAVVAAVVFVVRALGGSPGMSVAPPQSNRALEILKERYARGEIDKSEFDERRKVLGA